MPDNEESAVIAQLLSAVAEIPATKKGNDDLGKKGISAINEAYRVLLNRPELSNNTVIIALFKAAAQNNNKEVKQHAVIFMGAFGGLTDEAGNTAVANLPELLADPAVAEVAEDALMSVAAGRHESWEGVHGIGNYFRIAARPYLQEETIVRLEKKAADHIDNHRRFLWEKKIEDGIAALKRLEP